MERRPPWALSWHTILTWTDKKTELSQRKIVCTTLRTPRLFRTLTGTNDLKSQAPWGEGRKIVKEQKRKNVKGEKRKRETKKEKEGIKNR